MKRLHKLAAICIILLSLSFTTNLLAQTHEENSTVSDTTTTDKGDLKLLVDRIYLAFKAYRTGKYEFDKFVSDSMRAVLKNEAAKEGWHIDFPLINEQYIQPVIVRGENSIVVKTYSDDFTKIPSDSVISIEVMDVGTGISVLHGESSKGIVIRLKE